MLARGARPPLGAAGAWDDPEVDLGLPQTRGVARDDQVAHQGELAPTAERVAVHRRNQGFAEGRDAGPPARLIALQLIDRRAVGHVGDVGAGGEDARPPGQDHRPHLRVGVKLEQGLVDLADEIRAERVEDLGAVQRDRGDRGLDVDQDVFEPHRRIIRHVGMGSPSVLRDSTAELPTISGSRSPTGATSAASTACPPRAFKWLKRDDLLRFEEITRLARIFVQKYGVRTIRITGGEPLVRIKVEELVGMINDLDPTLDITMTTNGVLLRDKAQPLKDAGLKRINISLDTLNMQRFHEMARSDQFGRTMDGIDAAREVGLWPIKLNMVVMKGHNDDEVVDFARLARDKGYEVRFIEYMPLDGDGTWTNEQVVPSRRIQEQIEDLFPLVPINDQRPGPATRFKFADGAQGGLGFISSVSQAFCTTCNRMRLTAEGGLRTCLFSLQETPLRELLRSGASDEHLGRVIEAAVWRKEEGHLINQPGFIKPSKSMSQIGG